DVHVLVDDHVDHSVWEAEHLGGTNVGLLQQGKRERSFCDSLESLVDRLGEAFAAARILPTVEADVGGELTRRRRTETDHLLRLRFTSSHAMPGAPERASSALRAISFSSSI